MIIKPMTPRQIAAMKSLDKFVGKSVLVLTSQNTANIATQAVSDAVAIIDNNTLRALATRGLITITATMWKGAQIVPLANINDFAREQVTCTHAHRDRIAAATITAPPSAPVLVERQEARDTSPLVRGRCDWCGNKTGGRRTYCGPPCRVAYNNLLAAQGKTLMQDLKIWRMYRGRKGTPGQGRLSNVAARVDKMLASDRARHAGATK